MPNASSIARSTLSGGGSVLTWRVLPAPNLKRALELMLCTDRNGFSAFSRRQDCELLRLINDVKRNDVSTWAAETQRRNVTTVTFRVRHSIIHFFKLISHIHPECPFLQLFSTRCPRFQQGFMADSGHHGTTASKQQASTAVQQPFTDTSVMSWEPSIIPDPQTFGDTGYAACLSIAFHHGVLMNSGVRSATWQMPSNPVALGCSGFPRRRRCAFFLYYSVSA